MRTSGIESATVDCLADWNSQFASAQLVHIHGWNYPLAMHAARVARQAGKPYIISPLGRLTPGPMIRKGVLQRVRSYFQERPLVRGAAAVTALNDADQKSLQAARVHANIMLLPYGLRFRDAPQTAPDSQDDARQDQRLLMLGPLDPLLGCVVLLKAFAELGPLADGWNVTLAGDDRGDWRGKLEAAVRRKGGETRVHFQDAKTPEEQSRLLAEADLLVDASLHVSPPVSIMQALAAGVSVLATHLAAPPGLNGAIQVCGPGRSELREGLRIIMQRSPQQRREAAQRAREKAANLFDWSVAAPQYAAAYTGLRN